MKVTLRTKPLSNGSKSIYLDIYENGKRKYEYLRLYLIPELDERAKRINANALKKAEEIKALYVLGKHKQEERSNMSLTLLDWFDQYEKQMNEVRCVSKGVKEIIHLLRPILAGYLTKIRKKTIKIDAFGRNEVLGFLMYMRNWKAEKRVKLSQGTMVAYQQRLIAVFNAAIKEGLISTNPFELIENHERIPKVLTRKESLSMDEVEMIAKVIPGKEEDAQVQRVFLFGCFTGIRISDIRDLKWSDIKVIDGKKAIIKRQVKTDSIVTIPLCEAAIRYLPDKRENEYVFQLPKRTGFRLGFLRIIKASGIKKSVTFHTSRRTFATLTLASGSDLLTVSRLLGHTNVSTTEIYADVMMDSKLKAIQSISDLFK